MQNEKTSLQQQIDELKVLAGIYKPYQPEETQQENISYTGTEKSKYQKKHKIEPGTKEWFKLWFARPRMTGESPYGKE
jgi:hypothetical protein|tara:strand:+ start:2031 stop:2264 length:234 start_codon:yes stop_codon:yes gene_type:complete